MKINDFELFGWDLLIPLKADFEFGIIIDKIALFDNLLYYN